MKIVYICTLSIIYIASISWAQTCPSGTCPSDDTCCNVGEGQYGCCPYPNAVCCHDTTHCCPNGYTCDEPNRQCVASVIENKPPVARVAKFLEMKKVSSSVRAQACPSNNCPSGDTCCVLDSAYGCCPYTNAACCSDFLHCCPSGYKCDIGAGQCVPATASQGKSVYPIARMLFEKDLSKATTFDPCPSGTCPSSETCCDVGGGQFGCCPYENGVCCSDHAHCCPSGYICDVGKGECIKSVLLTAHVTKTSDAKHVTASKPQACPPNTCPSANTCCDAGGGQYGCCPYPNADCCEDHVHCCPNGYKCDINSGECVQAVQSTDLRIKMSEVKHVTVPGTQACPSGTCPSGETCCPLISSGWGCCPYENANCCSDGQNCCPAGYQCDNEQGTCNAISSEENSGERTVAKTELSKPSVGNTVGGCNSDSCPSSETCCAVSGGSFGCCPYPNAVCCSDHAHCCPSTFTCGADQCVKGTATLFTELKQ